MVRCDTFGPSGNATHYAPASACVHCRYAVDPARPWHGVAPLDWARSTGTLAAYLETRLGQEAGGTVAHVLPIPRTAATAPTTTLSPTSKPTFATPGTERCSPKPPRPDGRRQDGRTTSRLATATDRSQPPTRLPTLRGDTYDAVLAACGVPPDLARVSTAQGQRETFRRFLTTGIEPLGQLVADELAAKLDTPGVRIDFTGTYAHDPAGRASSFQKLVAGGMDLSEAVAISRIGRTVLASLEQIILLLVITINLYLLIYLGL